MFMSAKTKILNFLSTGKSLTASQARFQYGIQNVGARIHELRTEGHAIYSNSRTLKDGRKVVEYRIGQPSKRVVAAGYEALRSKGISAFE